MVCLELQPTKDGSETLVLITSSNLSHRKALLPDLDILHRVGAVSAGHVVVESCPALVLSVTLGTLEERRLARAAKVVILHASNTATFELTTLRRRGGGGEES